MSVAYGLGARKIDDDAGADLDALAESELLKCAQTIEQAAASLTAARKERAKRVQTDVGEQDVGVEIYDAAAASMSYCLQYSY